MKDNELYLGSAYLGNREELRAMLRLGVRALGGAGLVWLISSGFPEITEEDIRQYQGFGRIVSSEAPAFDTPVPPSLVTPEAIILSGGNFAEPFPNAPRYTVQEGDTLYSIATRHTTTVEALMRANGLREDLIHSGQELLIAMPSDMRLVPVESGIFKPVDANNDLPSVGLEVRTQQNLEQARQEADVFSRSFDYKAEYEISVQHQGRYFFSGELNSMPEKLENVRANVYGFNARAENLNPYTSTGERFDPNNPPAVCASWFYPPGSLIRITNRANGASAICSVRDRGPNRTLLPDDIPVDMSWTFARLLDPKVGPTSSYRVNVELIYVPRGYWEQLGR